MCVTASVVEISINYKYVEHTKIGRPLGLQSNIETVGVVILLLLFSHLCTTAVVLFIKTNTERASRSIVVTALLYALSDTSLINGL